MQLSVKPQVIRLDKGSSVNVSVGDTNNNALTVTIAEYLNLLGKTTSCLLYTSVYAWGWGIYGSLGDGDTSDHSSTVAMRVVGTGYSNNNTNTYLGDGNGSDFIVDLSLIHIWH